MSDASDAVQLEGRPQEKLYRALRWGCLGAASGIVAVIVTILPVAFDWDFYNHWGFLAVYVVPGLSYGLIIGIALRSQQLANWAQIAFLGFLSAGAWAISAYASVVFFIPMLDLFPYPRLDSVFVAGLVHGITLSALQTACFALLFPFARRPFHWVACMLAGICTAVVLRLILVEYFSEFFLREGWLPPIAYAVSFAIVLGGPWTCWYAVFTAALSAALPHRMTSQ